ncbi:MAG: SDR family NAD(P)-dependent oxidoreductase [Rhodobacteraceae bacterium]|nr:SDR family NAD(P)-dependent oxidoreductase [Paracoccaceae bacterium]
MPHALITGASDGIGRALVDVYHAKEWDITATARRPAEAIMPELPCAYVPLDLTTGAESLLEKLPPKLDLAILNAGAGKVAAPADHSAEDVAQMIALNTTAPLLLAQALFPRLEGGTLAFIGSTAARGAHKDFSVYAATKAALSGAARSLALEWEGLVKVLMLHPGPTATTMHDKAGLGDIAARRFFTPPAKVAASLADAIDRGKNRRLGAAYTARHALEGLFK